MIMKEPKASLVLTSYNKGEYIANMFDSILAQVYPSIELIIVDDGSTDNSREVIKSYFEKFNDRGIEYTYIEQENRGVCATAKVGMEQVSGDYLAIIDADDELHKEYLSKSCSFLNSNSDFDFVSVSCGEYIRSNTPQYINHLESPLPSLPHTALEWTIFCPFAIWSYVVRKSYFSKCHILENYNVSTRGSHEPFFAIPLVANGGRYVKLSDELVRTIKSDESHSRGNLVKSILHWDEYYKLQIKAIDSLPADIITIGRKENLKEIALLSRYKLFRNEMIREYSKISKGTEILPSAVNEELFFDRLELTVSGLDHHKLIADIRAGVFTSVIAYGVLGQRGRRYLPYFISKGIEFDEMWDIAASGEVIGGKKVSVPDFSRLNKDSLVFVFPKNLDVCFAETKTVSDLDGMTFSLLFEGLLGA